MTPTATKTRRWIANAGENLLQSQPPFNAANRLEEFEQLTGLGVEDVVLSMVCAIPLPRFAPQRFGRRRWQGVRADAMWHPLMWLPDVIGARRVITGGGFDDWIEDDDTWAVRLVTELAMCGLYNEESGTWVDVLNLYGLDVDDPAVRDRVEAWLQGGADPLLDSIDLAPHLVYPDDPAWSTALAAEIMPNLRVTAWWIAADALLEMVDGLDPNQASQDPIAFHASLRRAAILCDASFDTIEFWERDRAQAAVASWNGTSADLTDRLLAWMADQLAIIRDTFEDEVQQLAREAEAPIDPFAS